MSGIVNSTGARSGVIGTTVGTPIVSVSNINRPCFHVAEDTGGTSVASGTNLKLAWDTVIYDPDSYWDVANNRFTPTNGSAVYYYVTVMTNLGTSTDIDNVQIKVSKSGSYVGTGTFINRASNHFGWTGIISLNGSSEYIEVFIRQNSGSTLTSGSDPANNFFQAFALSI